MRMGTFPSNIKKRSIYSKVEFKKIETAIKIDLPRVGGWKGEGCSLPAPPPDPEADILIDASRLLSPPAWARGAFTHFFAYTHHALDFACPIGVGRTRSFRQWRRSKSKADVQVTSCLYRVGASEADPDYLPACGVYNTELLESRRYVFVFFKFCHSTEISRYITYTNIIQWMYKVCH